jgi:spermidine/putrescine transport system ATP-binding protein
MNLFEGEVVSRSSDTIVINARAVGTVTLPAATSSPVAGSRVLLALRPEKIAVATDGALKGRVSATNYLGAHTNLHIDVEGLSKPVAVSVQNAPSEFQAPGLGETVALNWNAQSFVILER